LRVKGKLKKENTLKQGDYENKLNNIGGGTGE
jgi:hypothetical protein